MMKRIKSHHDEDSDEDYDEDSDEDPSRRYGKFSRSTR